MAFAQRKLNDGIREREGRGEFRRDLWEACAEFGVQGMPIPVEYGGTGMDITTTMIAMDVSEHDSLLDREIIDSMALTEIMLFIEERTGGQVPDDEVTSENFETIADIDSLPQLVRGSAT